MTAKQKTAWQGGLLWSSTTTTDEQMLNQKTKGCNAALRAVANTHVEMKTLMYSAISPDSTEQKEKASTYREIREAGVEANHHSPGQVSALYAKGATFAYNRFAIV